MKKFINLFIFSLCLVFQGFAQVPIPAAAQSNSILLKGGTAHIGNGQVIENSLIAFNNGKLSLVQAANSNINESRYQVIDITGKHVYPGFILPDSPLGLEEVSSVRAMSDSRERGHLNPNIRSIISYNTDSEFPATMRFNGVLLAETTPRGGIISGSSSIVEMEGWNWEDAAHTVDVGLHLNWPSRLNRRFDFATFTMKEEPNKNYQKSITALKDHFADATAYGSLSIKEKNLKMEAMQGLFDGSKRLFIHAGSAKEIVEAVRFAQEIGVKNITLRTTGPSALYVADFLKENNIPIIINQTQSVPGRSHTAIDLPYELPHLLTEKGLTVSMAHSGMTAGGRNLAFYAGTAVAYGMDKEAALKTITSNTAKALGIDDRVGTLEVGKDATLFVSEGDALDYKGNILTHAFISGKQIVLSNKQQELYKRYSDKYGHNK
jgi:imidazolonepropionase-like amidohydrolase